MIEIANPYQECVMIYGMRGCGKSNILAYLVQRVNLKGLNIKVFDTAGRFVKFPEQSENLEIIKPRFALKEQTFEDLCLEVWRSGNTILCIEEIDQFCTPQFLPPHLDTLINLGRNRKVSLWMTTRRIASVHKDIVANSDHHFLFRAFLPNDITYYKQFIGDVATRLPDLEPYYFYHYQVGKEATLFKPIDKVI